MAAVLLPGAIAVWGLWFGVQAALALWWPVNAAYLAAGLVAAAVAAGLARAIVR